MTTIYNDQRFSFIKAVYSFENKEDFVECVATLKDEFLTLQKDEPNFWTMSSEELNNVFNGFCERTLSLTIYDSKVLEQVELLLEAWTTTKIVRFKFSNSVQNSSQLTLKFLTHRDLRQFVNLMNLKNRIWNILVVDENETTLVLKIHETYEKQLFLTGFGFIYDRFPDFYANITLTFK